MAVKQVLTLTQVSQDVLQNTSQLRILWTSTQTNDSHNVNKRTAYYWVSVNGGPEEEYSVSYKLNKKTTDTILDTTITIQHDEHGKAEVNVRTWMDTRISAGEVELEKSLQMEDIPRAAWISATDAYIGGRSTVIIGNLVSGYTVGIEYQFEGMTGYLDSSGNATEKEVRITATAINFALPESFYERIPNKQSAVCTLICRTYSGEECLGEEWGVFTATANPDICRPVIIAAIADINEKTVNLTGNEGWIVRGQSIVECSALAEPRNGASITEIVICGTTFQDSMGVVEINGAQTGVFEIYATDSRGYVGAEKVELPVVPYTDIVCTPAAGRTDPTSGAGWVSIEGVFFNGDFGAVTNTLQIACTVDGKTIEYAPTVEGDRYADRLELDGLDYTKSYTLEIVVTDEVGSITKSARILPGVPVFDWGEKDFKFNVPVDIPMLTINGQHLEGIEPTDKTTVRWVVEEVVEELELPNAKAGSGRDSMVLGDGNAVGRAAVAGGTTDKQLVENIVGSTAALLMPTPGKASANGDLSMSLGAGTVSHAAGTMSLGVNSQAGCLGYYMWAIAGNTIELALNRQVIGATRKKPTKLEWEKGDVLAINNGEIGYSAACNITITDVDTAGMTITVNELPFAELDTSSLGGYMPNDLFVYVPAKPSKGEIEMGFGAYSHGYNCIANGILSAALGYANTAHGTTAFVTGRENTGGFAALVGGYLNSAMAATCFAAGRENECSGDQGAVVGYKNRVTAAQGFAGGNGSTAAGKTSLAYGQSVKAMKDYAVALGYLCEALCKLTFVAGGQNAARANASAVLGFGNYTAEQFDANGVVKTGSPGFAQTVLGKYNAYADGEIDRAMFVVGGGTSDTNRKNVFVVDDSGNAKVPGSLAAKSIKLTSPDGAEWSVSMTNNGQLQALKEMTGSTSSGETV